MPCRVLINGSMGVVHDINWPAGAELRNALPRAVFVKFDNYRVRYLLTPKMASR